MKVEYIMKIKDILDELSKYDENTEVFVNDEEGHERIGIKFEVLKDKYFLHGRVQPIVIRLIGSLLEQFTNTTLEEHLYSSVCNIEK